ncbi:uncharacterized protein LOC124145491 [Haliotis rufescens]|uniref:uncharacterized protein LOC124145491 n=1 Tax=Haliotis rufescens TaxID=6454 RepID=UPI00201E8F0C|nr:uncharacterized protein LOC124145491 [Haliotis rufescens]
MVFREIFSGLGTGSRYLYQAVLHSLPRAPRPASLYFSLPEVQAREVTAANWTPVITCRTSRNPGLRGYNLTVTFSLPPARFQFEEFDVSLYTMTNLHNPQKTCILDTERPTPCNEIRNLASNNAAQGSVIFDDITQDHYMIEIQAVDPYWQWDDEALCFTVQPSGRRQRKECLRTRLKGIFIGEDTDDSSLRDDSESRQRTTPSSIINSK